MLLWSVWDVRLGRSNKIQRVIKSVEDLWKQALTALIPAIGTYLVAKSNNKTSGQKHKNDHNLQLFNEYKGLIDNLSRRVTTLIEDLEESEARNSEYKEEIKDLNRKILMLKQENFVLISENEITVKDNLRLERALERMYKIEDRNEELRNIVCELNFEIEILEEELATLQKS